MTNFFSRAFNSYKRFAWLSSLIGDKFSAVSYLLKARSDHRAIGRAKYNELPFSFRSCDLSALKEVFIDSEYAFLKPFLNKIQSPVIVDVGAHIGTFALWSLSVNPKAKILSIEADPETFKTLSENIFQFDGKYMWWAINKAEWKNDEALYFSDHGESMGHRVSGEGNIEVQGINLLEAIKQSGYAKIDLAKIDIEGAEEAFICTYPQALRQIDRLVIELHSKYCNVTKVHKVLEEAFPIVEEILGRESSKPLLYCRK